MITHANPKVLRAVCMFGLAFSADLVAAEVDMIAQTRLAVEVGTIIGSEKGCDLTLGVTAIEAFITDRSDPADLGFASGLNTMTAGTEYQVEQMSPSARAAHCAAVIQSARHYGLID